MNPNIKFSEKTALLAAINPSSQAAGAAVSGWVSVRDYHRIAGVILAGALGASASLDAKIQQATDSSGTGAKDITGTAITQLTQAGSGSNKQVIIEVDVNALDVNNGFAYVQLSVTVGTAASLTAAAVLGLNPRYMPASAGNAASVAQIVG